MERRPASLVALAALPLVAVLASAQRPGVPAPETPATGRTAWGDPRLEGVWTSGLMIDVPFERDPALSTRALLTDDELATLRTAKARQTEADLGDAPNANPVAIFPSHWLERGSVSRQSSLIVEPPTGRLPGFTDDGARRAKLWRDSAERAAGPEDLNPYDRCITRGVLGSIFPNIYNSAVQIVQTPGYVVLHHEMIHESRIIPVDGRPHLPASFRQYMGDSRGRWEGRSLVIETTNLNGTTGTLGRNGNGNPTSASARFVERLTIADSETLQYEVRIEDAQTWIQPWTVAFPLARAEGYTVYEYACHEGNYAMADILRGARAVPSASATAADTTINAR